MVVEPEWNDDDTEWLWVAWNSKLYTFMSEDMQDTKLFNVQCTHEEYEILEINYDDD